jgi:DNA ligase (NAD+)
MNTIAFFHTKTQKECEEKLKMYEDAYYNKKTLISDDMYDTIEKIHKSRHSDYVKLPGARVEDRIKATLPYFLGSLDNIKKDEKHKMDLWIKKYPGPYIIGEKVDGVSALLVYSHGEYDADGSGITEIHMYTRGNGKVGVDISHLLKYIQVPEFEVENTFAVRGEIVMTKQMFNNKYKKNMSNPRGATSGLVNSQTANVQDLIFVAYNILEPSLRTDKHVKILKKNGFTTISSGKLNILSIEKLTDIFDKWKNIADYEIDGIVIGNIGIHKFPDSGNPKWSFAFKTNELTSSSKVVKVHWNISKHGMLKPRVEIEPTQLSGALITFATGFNASFIEKNKIGPGAVITLVRSGDVIPYIQDILLPSKTAQMPDIPYEWNSSHVDIITTCNTPEQAIKKITNFCQTLNINFVSQKTIEKLYHGGFTTLKHILAANVEAFMTIEGIKNSGAIRIFDNLHRGVQNVPLPLLMAASSEFPIGVGQKRIQLLQDTFECKNLQDFNLKISDIINVKTFSHKTSLSYCKGYDNFVKFYNNIKTWVTYTIVSSIVEGGKMNNQVVVFTGFRDNDLKILVETQGGIITTGITSKTTLVVAADPLSSSCKLSKALDKGIRVISKIVLRKEFLNNI